MPALPLAAFVCPVVRDDASLNDKLIALTGVPGDVAEGEEPEGGDGFACRALSFTAGYLVVTRQGRSG